MFIKILVVALALNFASFAQAAWKMHLPTEEQIAKLCVPIVMSTDHDVHYFYYKHIEFFDETGLVVKYGRGLSSRNFIAREQIENYFDALVIYNRLIEEQP